MADQQERDAAIRFLREIMEDVHATPAHNRAHARLLLKELAAPRLPAEPPEEALNAIHMGHMSRREVERIYRALYEHLAAPKTKTVYEVSADMPNAPEAWVYNRDDDAIAQARKLMHRGFDVTIAVKKVPA